MPKQERFKDSLNKLNTESMYTIPESKRHKGTGIGIGERSSIILNTEGPSPDRYKIPCLFELNRLKGKGYKIGEKISYKNEESGKTPGPQNYFPPMDWKKQNPLTMKFRHGFYYDEEMKYKGAVISPQKYQPKYKSTDNTRFQNIKIGIGLGNKTWGKSETLTPGPGEYNLPSIFDKKRKFKYALN